MSILKHITKIVHPYISFIFGINSHVFLMQHIMCECVCEFVCVCVYTCVGKLSSQPPDLHHGFIPQAVILGKLWSATSKFTSTHSTCSHTYTDIQSHMNIWQFLSLPVENPPAPLYLSSTSCWVEPKVCADIQLTCGLFSLHAESGGACGRRILPSSDVWTEFMTWVPHDLNASLVENS